MWELWDHRQPLRSTGSAQSSYRTAALRNLPTVLYADIAGRWSPLQNSFWSSDSQALVSAHPESSTEEVCETLFCPSCFEVANAEDENCPFCFECPICSSNLLESCGLDGSFYLLCPHCLWSSQDVGLTGETSESLFGSLRCLTSAADPITSAVDPSGVPASLHEGCPARNAQEELTLQANKFASLMAHFSRPEVRKDQPLRSRSWLPKDSDEMIAHAPQRNSSVPLESSPLYSAEERRSALAPVAGAAPASEGSTLRQRLADPSRQPRTISELLPRRRALRGRKERRSRKDVAEGKPGILVMPKSHPLEGDTTSELKSKKGEWWLKMNSGIDFVPRITLDGPLDLRPYQGGVALRLRVYNPRYRRVSVWFGPGPAVAVFEGGLALEPLRVATPSAAGAGAEAAVGWFDPPEAREGDDEAAPGPGLVLEPFEDYLSGHGASAAAAWGNGADNFFASAKGDSACVQVALEAPEEPASVLSISLVLYLLEHPIEPGHGRPLRMPLLVTVPAAALPQWAP
mmetsp:Transcript_55443/g.125998  ORF Transcript_55443/g.125998 Transcript_55443/m.125998 type:complete len:517 (+) Transcript_55443:95-1645(+)